MTSSSHGINQSSTNSEMTKPNCTITERHDQQLDELAKTRHVSRSAALRTAIEQYTESVSDENQTAVERLIKQVTSLADELQELHKKIDELERGDTPRNHTANSTSKSKSTTTQPDTDQAATAVQSNSLNLENDIYKLLNERDSLTLRTIADDLDENEIAVRGALDRLVERDFVTCVDHSENIEYSIRTHTDK